MILLLSLLIPVVSAPIIYLAEKKAEKIGLALLLLISVFEVILYSYAFFNLGYSNIYTESYAWINLITPQAANIKFTLFIDGLSYVLVVTTSILFLFSALYSCGYITREKPVFYALLSLLYTGLLGVFISANLLAFYIFWEFMLLPSYFIIARWGYRDPAKVAFKFFIFTHAGAVFIIVALGLLAMLTGGQGLELFMIKQLYDKIAAFWIYIFAFLTFGFAVKMAIFPVHTWLPDAHGEAPAPMSSLLSGIIIEAGAYAILRISFLTILAQNPALTLAEASSILVPLALLGVITAFYGGFMALKEVDVKRIIAYSSISHMGYILAGEAAGTYALLAGANPLALFGVAFHLVAHAWSKGLFFLVGGSVMHQTHMRDITKMSGLMDKMPYTGIAGIISIFSIAGAPPLPCFISEFMIIAGIASIASVNPNFLYIAVFMAIATLISAAYSLRYFWQVFWYKEKIEVEAKEANKWMLAGMLGLAVFIVLIGFTPWIMLSLVKFTTPSLKALVELITALK